MKTLYITWYVEMSLKAHATAEMDIEARICKTEALFLLKQEFLSLFHRPTTA